MLKNLALWLIFAAFCFTNSKASSHEVNSEGMIELADRIYIESDQINFADKKIYIQIKDSIFETPAVHSDEKGYYIDQVAKSGNCAWYEWECREETCLTCNLRGTLKCGRCGRGISE